MTLISERFADELTEKEMRDAYVEAQTRVMVAQQIRALRMQRDWSQSELGERMGKPQGNVARLEDVEIARYTLTSLFEIAAAFDVAILVQFVSYPEFLQETADLGPDALRVPSFDRAELESLSTDAQSNWRPTVLQSPLTFANAYSNTVASTTGTQASLSGTLGQQTAFGNLTYAGGSISEGLQAEAGAAMTQSILSQSTATVGVWGSGVNDSALRAASAPWGGVMPDLMARELAAKDAVIAKLNARIAILEAEKRASEPLGIFERPQRQDPTAGVVGRSALPRLPDPWKLAGQRGVA